MSQPHAPFAIGHFDVAGPDLARLAPFYAGVFGWQVAPRGTGYAQLRTPEGSPDGALVEQPQAALTLGIVVPDLDHALAQAESSGGRVEMPATDNGWVRKAQVRDPAGNLLTLIQQ
ncbi:MAG: VOC family protein [Pelomonas sp.]|nr:VOC family protein [Roseateles sp.]